MPGVESMPVKLALRVAKATYNQVLLHAFIFFRIKNEKMLSFNLADLLSTLENTVISVLLKPHGCSMLLTYLVT